jgi:hypothetical protein
MAARAPEDAAVSPVIGTILMIGIMIVLATVIFVIVRGIQVHPEDATPHLLFVPQGDTLVVASIPPGTNFDWYRDIRISGPCSDHIELTPVDGPTAAYPASPGTPVRPGDILGHCTPGEEIIVSYKQQERVLFRHVY